MVIKILIGLAVLILLLVAIIAMRPSTFRVERSITIAAPPENAFAQVNDFHAWGGWSPWDKKDPGMKRTYGGPPQGVGSTYAWAGDRNVGEGRMTIERSDRPSQVGIKLEFIKPFAGTNHTTFTFTPSQGGTTVRWVMDGHYNFITKGMSMVMNMNMDKMIGTDFEAGLSGIKAVAERTAAGGAGMAEAR